VPKIEAKCSAIDEEEGIELNRYEEEEEEEQGYLDVRVCGFL